MQLLVQAVMAVEGDPVLRFRILYLQTLLGASLLIKYFDLQKMAERQGEPFEYDREAVRQLVLEGFEEAKKRPRFSQDTERLDNIIRYFKNLTLGDEEKASLPTELSGVNPEDTYQFFFKNSCRHVGDYMHYGVSVVEDPASSLGKVEKMCMDHAKAKFDAIALFLTSREAENKRPITISIEQNAKPVCSLELYREDLVPDEYHLYKIGSVSGIQESGDTRVDIFGINFDWLSLTGISVAFPMGSCDVYLSMKFTGELYGGDAKDEDAVYVDRAIVVRR